MQIRILGSVDVEREGTRVKLAGPKQRAVLSMLALNANTAVSFERLVDGLWGEEPPATAPKMVQQYVSQLRRLLAADGSPRSSPVTAATSCASTPLRSTRCASSGWSSRRRTRSTAGGRSWPTRLWRIWQDPPLSGMREEPFAACEARRLEELHLAVLELAIEGDLDAGRHAELAGRLAALVDEHPLRERLRALLMLALYRSGRQAEALDAFRDARWTLVETLGIEPGPELRRLQEAILRQDPVLDLVVPDHAWADRETVQQVGEQARGASQRRTELRAIELELAGNVIDLHTLRERRGSPRGRDAAAPTRGSSPSTPATPATSSVASGWWRRSSRGAGDEPARCHRAVGERQVVRGARRSAARARGGRAPR